MANRKALTLAVVIAGAILGFALIKEDPNSYEAVVKHGIKDLQIGKISSAEEWLRKARELDPKRVNAHSTLGSLYVVKKRYDDIEREIEPLLKDQSFMEQNASEPKLIAALYRVAAIGQHKKKNWDKGLLYYCAYLASDGKDSDASEEFELFLKDMKAATGAAPDCKK